MRTLLILLSLVSCNVDEDLFCECKQFEVEGKPVSVATCEDNIPYNYEQALAVGKKQNCPQ